MTLANVTRLRRRLEGLCITCGRINPVAAKRSRCRPCAVEHSEKQKQRQHRKAVL